MESSILSPPIRDQEPPEIDEPKSRDAKGPETEEDLSAQFGLGLDSLNLEDLESQAIIEALRRCSNNQVQAAKLLGISRQSLRRRMERLGFLKSSR